jgi:hypothetical protein
MRLMMSGLLVGLMAACSSGTEPFGPTVDVSLVVSPPTSTPMTLFVTVGSRTATLPGPISPTAQTTSRLYMLAPGDMPVVATLMGDHADTLASVAISASVRADYDQGVGAYVSRTRPLGFCMGPVTAAPLRNGSDDSLFVFYSGIPKGAVC